MAKQFVERNTYVFSAKKYLKWHRSYKPSVNIPTWHKDINGRIVNILTDDYGNCNEYSVGPEWCKCIENNQGRL
ncbi:hypothetical protein EXM33_13620 [Clostridium botulinum]|nr:hypothetical protein [Clostridium botulinum]NFA19676.1 hypothetical protein [Clostridium botulinum]NFA55835.1 hypothetical protein [Clostridium botulinum]NFA71484.1 hypothetical protein [Clostridium botulinum]NFA77094.1 hypothetical protein [Clostridium botulinum]